MVVQWLDHRATDLKVGGSISGVVSTTTYSINDSIKIHLVYFTCRKSIRKIQWTLLGYLMSTRIG